MAETTGSLPVPSSILEDCFAVLGKRGAGKSNVRQVLFEHELDVGHRSILIDPKGDSYGVRMAPDGSPSRFEIPIFGGRHGDYELEEHAGDRLGEMLATHDVSCVIDLSNFYLEEQRRFMLPFARALLKHNRNALTLLIEEADLLAPQIGGAGGPTTLVNAMGALVKVGRQRGIVAGMFTQRPQSLNKNLLSQIDSLIAMKVTSPRDRDAFKEWFVAHSDEAAKTVLAEAGKLAVGEAFVWISSDDYFERVRFPMHSTYDSGRAPKHGESVDDVALQPLPAGEIAALLEAVAEPEKPAVKASPVANAELERLRTENASLKMAVTERDHRIGKLERRILNAVDALQNGDALPPMLLIDDRDLPAETKVLTTGFNDLPPAPAYKPGEKVRHNGETLECVANVPHGCQKPLAVLAKVYPAGMSEAQWATAAGFKRTGGTWRTYRGRLKTAGLIEERDGTFYATETGAKAVPDVDLDMPAPGPDLARWWGGKIHGTPKLIEALIPAYPGWITKQALAEAVGMEPEGGSFRTYIGRLSSPGFLEQQKSPVDGARVYRLSPDVMG